MNQVNLLNWRRRKLSQRTFRLLAIGLLWLGGLTVLLASCLGAQQVAIKELQSTYQLYQQLVNQLGDRTQQQKTLLDSLAQVRAAHQWRENVRDELEGYTFFFHWLVDNLPEQTWLTAMTNRHSRWDITGQSLTLEAIEHFTHQLLRVEKVTEFQLNSLQQRDEHYQFRISFLLLPLSRS